MMMLVKIDYSLWQDRAMVLPYWKSYTGISAHQDSTEEEEEEAGMMRQDSDWFPTMLVCGLFNLN